MQAKYAERQSGWTSHLRAHYTSEKKILKLIQPLFLVELHEEFEIIKAYKNSAQRCLPKRRAESCRSDYSFCRAVLHCQQLGSGLCRNWICVSA